MSHFPLFVEGKIKSYQWESNLHRLLSSCPTEGKFQLVESPDRQHVVLFRTDHCCECDCDFDQHCDLCQEDYFCTFYRRGDCNQLIEIFKIERISDHDQINWISINFGVEFLDDLTFLISTKYEFLDVCRIEGDSFQVINSFYVGGEIEDVIKVNNQRYFLLKYSIRGLILQGMKLIDAKKFINHEKDFQVRLLVARNLNQDLTIDKNGASFFSGESHSYEYLFYHHEKVKYDIWCSNMVKKYKNSDNIFKQILSKREFSNTTISYLENISDLENMSDLENISDSPNLDFDFDKLSKIECFGNVSKNYYKHHVDTWLSHDFDYQNLAGEIIQLIARKEEKLPFSKVDLSFILTNSDDQVLTIRFSLPLIEMIEERISMEALKYTVSPFACPYDPKDGRTYKFTDQSILSIEIFNN